MKLIDFVLAVCKERYLCKRSRDALIGGDWGPNHGGFDRWGLGTGAGTRRLGRKIGHGDPPTWGTALKPGPTLLFLLLELFLSLHCHHTSRGHAIVFYGSTYGSLGAITVSTEKPVASSVSERVQFQKPTVGCQSAMHRSIQSWA